MKVSVQSNIEEDQETEYGRIPRPPAKYSEEQEEIEELQERFGRRVIDLDDDIRREVEHDLWIKLTDWNESRSALEQKLRAWNDLFEGVTPQTDFPWIGASSVHIPLPKIKGREIAATINRSTMRPIPFLTTQYAGPASLYDQSKDFVKTLESFLEDKIKNDTNIHETIKEGIVPTYRDGTCPIHIMWDTQYEVVTDWKLYENVQDFTTDYPSAEDAGISESRYGDIIKKIGSGGKYEAQFEYNSAIYDGPRAYLVPLIDFVHWPVWVPRIRDMQLHGKRIWWTDYQIEQKVRDGFFSQEDADYVLNYKGGEVRQDRLTISRDVIEGITRGSRRLKAKEFQVFELVYIGALTPQDRKENVVRKYLVYYHLLSRRILRAESYPIRRGKVSYFALRFIKRDNRFLGVSLVDDISDMSAEVDTTHRQRINSRTITHVPSFKAKMTAKGTFDPSRREFRFRPGVTFYMNDPADVQQFDIRPVDLSGSTEDEMLLYQLIDQVTGSSSGLSGQVNPIDPRAPARKQQELLRQSSNRIDDYVQNLLPVFEEIGQFVIDLYYQFGPDKISYYTRSEDGQILEKEIDRTKLFDPNIRFKVNGTSVFVNPDLEYARMQEIYQILGTDPSTASNPRIRRNALERVLMAARVDDEKSLLPNAQEMPQAFATDDQVEREAAAASQREKLAAKLTEAAAKRDHELKVMHAQSVIDAHQTILEAQLTPPPAPEGQGPVIPAPTPAGMPGPEVNGAP